MYPIFDDMLFENKKALNLYKMIAHLKPNMNITKPINVEDVMSKIKQLCKEGYKFPEEQTFFYNEQNKYVLYKFISKQEFKDNCKEFSTLGWNDEYSYLKNDTTGEYICI